MHMTLDLMHSLISSSMSQCVTWVYYDQTEHSPPPTMTHSFHQEVCHCHTCNNLCTHSIVCSSHYTLQQPPPSCCLIFLKQTPPPPLFSLHLPCFPHPLLLFFQKSPLFSTFLLSLQLLTYFSAVHMSSYARTIEWVNKQAQLRRQRPAPLSPSRPLSTRTHSPDPSEYPVNRPSPSLPPSPVKWDEQYTNLERLISNFGLHHTHSLSSRQSR